MRWFLAVCQIVDESYALSHVFVGAGHDGIKFSAHFKKFLKIGILLIEKVVGMLSADDDYLHFNRERLGLKNARDMIAGWGALYFDFSGLKDSLEIWPGPLFHKKVLKTQDKKSAKCSVNRAGPQFEMPIKAHILNPGQYLDAAE